MGAGDGSTDFIKRLDYAEHFAFYGSRWDEIPSDQFVNDAMECHEDAGILAIQVAGRDLRLLCGKSVEGHFVPKSTLRKFEISDTLMENIAGGAVDAERRSDWIAPAILHPDSKRVLAKVREGRPIGWRELRILIVLAEAGQPEMKEALGRPLASLLGPNALEGLDADGLASIYNVLHRIEAYWPAEASRFAKEIYERALPLVDVGGGKLYDDISYLHPPERERIKFARWVVRDCSEIIYNHAVMGCDPEMTEFFLREICQRPNPSVTRVINKMIAAYREGRVPPQFLDFANRYFSSPPEEGGYDLHTAEDCYYRYFNRGQFYPHLLAFLYRMYGRRDAMSRLSDITLTELGIGQQEALDVYLGELVETDRDVDAIGRLKRVLVDRWPALRKRREGRVARINLLHGILRRNASYEIFGPFLKGAEAVVIGRGPSPLYIKFDPARFGREDILPPHIFEEAEPIEDARVLWSSLSSCEGIRGEEWLRKNGTYVYWPLVKGLLERGLFGAVRAHLRAHYEDYESDVYSKVHGWRRRKCDRLDLILDESMGYEQMHGFLRGYADRGDPHLGFEVARAIIERISSDFVPAAVKGFFEKFRDVPLDSVTARLELEGRRQYGGGEFLDRGMSAPILGVALKAMKKGFDDAARLIADGLGHNEIEYRHAYVDYFSGEVKPALLKKYREADYVVEGCEEARDEQIATVRDHLSLRVDLAYIPDLLSGLVASSKWDEETVTRFMINTHGLLLDLAFDHRNKTVTAAVDGLLGFVDEYPLACEADVGRLDGAEKLLTTIGKKTVSIADDLIKKWKRVASRQNEESAEATDRLREMIAAAEVHMGRRPDLAELGAGLIHDISDESPLTGEGVRALMRVARARGVGSIYALERLLELYSKGTKTGFLPPLREGQPLSRELNRFLVDYKLDELFGKACHPRPGNTVEHEALAGLVRLGNPHALPIWLGIFATRGKQCAGLLDEVEGLKEFERECGLAFGLEELGRVMADMDDGGASAMRVADFATKLYGRNERLIAKSIATFEAKFAGDPLLEGALKSLGEGPIMRIGFEALVQRARIDDEAYAYLCVLALADIPYFSSKACREMGWLPHHTPVRHRIYEAFATSGKACTISSPLEEYAPF